LSDQCRRRARKGEGEEPCCRKNDCAHRRIEHTLAANNGLTALGHDSRDRELVQRTVARFYALGLGCHVAETPAYL
jgi:hypothetical protein